MSIEFADLNLDKNILSAVRSEGYESPTPIQAQTIPFVLEGRDIMASVQTGFGKTAVFLLPTLQRLTKRSEKPGKGPRALVLTPTRELAAQVEKNALAYAKNIRWFRTVSIVDGASFGHQTRALSKPVGLIVVTSGRLMDLIQSGKVDFDRLEVLILDEADRTLDMGFIDDIEIIVEATPSDRQTLLFSATWGGAIGKLARKLTKGPEIIEIERVGDQGKVEEQLLYCDDMRHKNRLLDHILRDASIDQCMIFTSTKAMTGAITDDLYEKGFAANCLYGDMPQGWRNCMLMDLRKGRCKTLVATDVAVRGTDVSTITHVINCDLSKQAEDYVHRTGRIGRTGHTGTTITLAEVNEYVKVRKVEKYIGRKLTELTAEGMEPTRKCRSASGKPKDRSGWGDGKKTGFKAKGGGFEKGGEGFKVKCKSGGESGGKDRFGKASRPAKR